MVHKLDLLALKAKLHNDYHNLKTHLHNAIANGGTTNELEELYENLVESGYEAVSQTLKYKQQHIKFLERVERRTKSRMSRQGLLYPYIDRTQLKQHEA